MAIVVIFDIPGMTSEQYDQTVKLLAEKGLGSPDGRLYHVASSTDNGWHVIDVYESADKLEAFGASLAPILESVGVTLVPPVIHPIHNIING